MRQSPDKKIFFFSALFISVALNVPRLLALRKDGVIARIWHFNIRELIFQFLFNFLFCLFVFFFNDKIFGGFPSKNKTGLHWRVILYNFAIFAVATALSVLFQQLFFEPGLMVDGGNGFRFIVSYFLIIIEFRLIDMTRATRLKENENQLLRNAWLQSELEVLKGQLNPHFFFNSLSSLSAVVRENPEKAQDYIHDLSQVYRYSLQVAEHPLVSLQEEIKALLSYTGLLKMRYEGSLQVHFKIDDRAAGRQLPHMSLQPLVENAVKHNLVSKSKPLTIYIETAENSVLVRNNLQPLPTPEKGVSIGLTNLRERYRILMESQIEVRQTATEFIVILPIK